TAVFLPMAFFGGSTGVIYRQFSVTIVSAMSLSIFVALILTPSLCATLLKPAEVGEHPHHGGLAGRFFNWFNGSYAQTQAWYRHNLEKVLRHSRLMLAVYALILIGVGVMFYRLPTGFLPDEDQGFIMTLINLPTGATQAKTLAMANKITDYYLTQEKKNVDLTFTVAGVNPIAGVSQNSGVAFTKFIDWGKRPGKQNTAAAIAQRAFMHFFGNPEAQVFPLVFPSVPELGFSTGFDLQMQDRANLGHEALIQARNQLLGMAMMNHQLAQV